MADQENKLDRVIRTAKANICAGVIQEPRWYWDEITTPADLTTIVFSNPDAFKNGEAYPVRITHAVVAIRDSEDDERLIQHVGARFTFHGQDYMGRLFVPFSLWQSNVVASPGAVMQGQASCSFPLPFVLAARDTMRVQVQLQIPPQPDESRTAAVSFTGYGLVTERVYFKSGSHDLSTTILGNIINANYRNDGDEPIVMTDMTVYLSASSGTPLDAGDIRDLRVQIQQIGNGTNAQWMSQSPQLAQTCMPAVLCGTLTGRSIVHEFPKDGLIWEPGEGLQVELQTLNLDAISTSVAIGLMGTISVT